MSIRSKYALLMFLVVGSLFGQRPTSVVRGQVFSADGKAISGVHISVENTTIGSLTDSRGNFELSILNGEWSFNFSKIGFQTVTLNVKAETPLVSLDQVNLEPIPTTEMAIKVVGSLREGQQRALDEQRLAPNIKNIVASDQMGQFPDKNAAEATQRIPGITIARDQGEGRYVQVRGTEARLNQTLLNGLVLPAPEGDLRTVALDVMPIDLLDAIEVTKAITPDMDGDAVGGVVNLVPKRAPQRQLINVGGALGQNQLSEGDLVSGNVLFGQRFANDKFGVIASLSYEDTDRGTDNFEVEYDDGLPDEFEQRDYEVNRKRIGGHFSLDFQPSSQASFSLNTTYAQFDDQEFRRRLKHKLSDERLERELKDRFESQLISSAQFQGDIYTQSGGHFNFSLSHGYARESEPDRMDTTFRQNDVVFAPNFSNGRFNPGNIQPNPTSQDLAAFEFDDLVVENNKTTDEHNALRFSYEWPSSFGDNTLVSWKVGGKFRQKEKQRSNRAVVFESSQDLSLSNFLDPSYNETSFLSGRYQMGSFIGRHQARELLANFADESEVDREEEAANFDITEDSFAAYGMATMEIGSKWTILSGLRLERLDNKYLGFEVIFDDEGDYLETLPTRGQSDNDMVLPMIHANYHLEDNRQLRTALTRSYARARVYDAVPYRLLLREDNEIEEGNPNLELTDVWNFDLSYEHYFQQVGLFSIGGFYKDFTDYIYTFRTETMRDGENFEVTRPQNGEQATLWGAELAFQKNFTQLPDPFNGLGLYFNYTLTDSDATLVDRDITLPGQSEEMGNLALQYERGGFSVRVSGNLQGDYILEVGDEAAKDRWVNDRLQWDLTATYRYRGMKFYLEAINLSDEAYIIYEGTSQTPIQYERYKSWGRIGFNYAF